MTIEERDELLKSVISALLDKRVLDQEISRIVLDSGEAREGLPAPYAAVEIILNKMEPSQSVADFAIEKCLELYEKGKKSFLGNESSAPLNAATVLVFCGASASLKEKVIAAVAEKGWYGRIEGLAQQLLNRSLTVNEVMALVDHYVNDKASRAEHQERALLRMAQVYAPEKLSEVRQKLDKFIKVFEMGDGY